VNSEIQKTVNSQDTSDRFSLLNNGITIVAKQVQQIGSNFTLRDYQVVNGCQTSHILFFNKDKISEKTHIPIKLIVTSNIEVASQIIEATNSQTEVKKEAFESLKTFHKQLEEFYKAVFKPEHPLYYERRSKQYATVQESNQVISLATQVHCYTSMFLNEPHSTHRYYGELLRSLKDKLFREEHNLYPYYCSGYAYAVVQKLFSKKVLDYKKYGKFRFHLLMIFRILVDPSKIPYSHNKKIESYCEKQCNILWDEVQSTKIFKKAAELVDQALTIWEVDESIFIRDDLSYMQYEASRRKSFTNELLNLLNFSQKPVEVGKEQGKVKNFNRLKGFGFILGKYSQDIFVHISDVVDDLQFLNAGDLVEFIVVKNNRGLNAKSVKVIQENSSECTDIKLG
jgi:cold shock CspA family protein